MVVYVWACICECVFVSQSVILCCLACVFYKQFLTFLATEYSLFSVSSPSTSVLGWECVWWNQRPFQHSHWTWILIRTVILKYLSISNGQEKWEIQCRSLSSAAVLWLLIHNHSIASMQHVRVCISPPWTWANTVRSLILYTKHLTVE